MKMIQVQSQKNPIERSARMSNLFLNQSDCVKANCHVFAIISQRVNFLRKHLRMIKMAHNSMMTAVITEY